MRNPPSGGPRAGISAVGTIRIRPRPARSCGAKARNSSVIPTGVSSPPATPWTARAAASEPRLGAAAHRAEARVKALSAPRKTRFTPYRSPSLPATGRPRARPTRKAVSTALAAETGRPKSSAMLNSAGLTMVESRPFMHIAAV